ncbi:MAG TPA: stalk domain-containing protein [Syntrophomonadaceae bacterium]|nr:stalk domain-containing protein [Syntrophomonadaceae bacterium]
MERERMKSKKSLFITLLVTCFLLMLTSVAFAALPGSNLITSPGAITTPVIVDALEPIQTIKPVSVITIPYKSRHETIEAVPLYRAYDTEWDRHYYSNNYDSHQTMLSYPGMVDDGKAGYISSVPLPYTVPLWHMVRGGSTQYFTTSEANRDYFTQQYAYENYGIMGYVVNLNDTAHGDSTMFQWYRADLAAADEYSGNDDHYYNNYTQHKAAYSFEGAQFRVWSDTYVLQEITVTSPNGGETLTGGTNTQIKWNTLTPGGNVSLFYTLDPDQGWSKIAENLPNNGSYTWQVPNSASSKAIVEARWTYAGIDANCFDQSDKYFSIKTGSGALSDWAIQFKPINMAMLVVPAAPTNLSIFSIPSLTPLSLFWKDNADNETGYVIERKTTGGSFAKLTQVGKNVTKYTDSNTEVGKTYTYRVKAVNSSLSSAYSNEAAGSVFLLQGVKTPGTTPGTIVPGTQQPGQIPGNQVIMLFTLNRNTYSVNGVAKIMDVSPASIEGRTMLPVRFMADPLGAVTTWDGPERKVTVNLGATKLELWIGSSTALLNGAAIQIDPQNPTVKPLIINGRTMLPMRFVAEKLGCEVEWLPQTSQIEVTYPNN